MIDALENRLLLSLSTLLNKGTLNIGGTPTADAITVDVANSLVAVAINSATFTAPLNQVKRIVIDASGGNDRVILTDNANIPATLLGGDGADYLRGGPKPCRLEGGAGNDTLAGGHGRDTFFGGNGIDTVDYSDRTENLQVYLDGKANDGSAATPATPSEGDNAEPDVENLIGGSGNDKLTGNALNNTLIGGPGDDTLWGNDGNDLLVGNAGADSLAGGRGDDILLAIDGITSDTLDGGDGYDSAAYDILSGIKEPLKNVEGEVLTMGL